VSLDWLNSDIGMLGRVNEGVEGSEDLVEYGEGEDGGCGQEQDNEENPTHVDAECCVLLLGLSAED